jgi:hypothetical protein
MSPARCVECNRILFDDDPFERTSRGPLCGQCAPTRSRTDAGLCSLSPVNDATPSRQALAKPPRPRVEPVIIRRYREMAA